MATAEIDQVTLYAMSHGPWQEVLARLRPALEAHRLGQLIAPTTLILHDLVDNALRIMHLRVFRNILEADVGLPFEGGDAQLEPLYKAELSEHGSQNIAHACAQVGWQVVVRFPRPESSGSATVPLLEIDVPFIWEHGNGQADRLIDALGFRLESAPLAAGSRITLAQQAGRLAECPNPEILEVGQQVGSLAQIFDQLGYGLIRFSAVGGIIAVSAAMLARLRLDASNASIDVLAEAIPLIFHQDVIWGMALAEANNGAFENYRIRVQIPGASALSILFNVSGFRHADGTIHSLWQVVSQEEGARLLSEGSIISEVRIHNITRNYVPQLVEQKARDAIRMGKTSLTNEEREVAVLFCDIVGFTSYVEKNASSESVIDTLNSILRRVSVSVKRNRGSIDKFMGDCIMALFDDPAAAVLAAIDMQSHAEDINSLRFRAGQQTLQLRIGIHWGEVVIGNVGTAERLDWTAIGDVVNTASRIEKGCQPGSILISREVMTAIEASQPGKFACGEIFGLQVKGKQDDLAVCHVSLAATDGLPGSPEFLPGDALPRR
jgi:class 3 adenylate cyclase